MSWQPIETAPRHKTDGWKQQLLLTDGRSIYIGFWNGRSWDDGDFYDDMGEMTHWQPLPELPA